jgi:LruC domain-containing protein
MRKLLILLIGINTVILSAIAQVTVTTESHLTNDAELGDRDLYFARCWSMGAVTVSNHAGTLISGNYSFRTNPLTDESNKASWLISPWVTINDGNISFDTRLDGNSGGNRAILIQYVSFDAEQNQGHGKEKLIHTFDFPNPISNQTSVHHVSVKVPEEIVGKTVKIFFSYIGTGGSARAGFDNLHIPGQYAADPSKGCLPKDDLNDSDGDGVPDEEDDYPNDPHRAFDNHFPAEGYGTLLFEDLWPSLGDYDFNDLVVDYRINRVTDAKGEVVEIITDLKTRASGAGYRNGFGIEFSGVSPDQVIKVSGTEIKAGSIHTFRGNGLEAGVDYLTYIPFDDVFNVLPHTGQGATGVNVTPGGPFREVVRQKVTVTLKEEGKPAPGGAVTLGEIGPGNFNPFLIANQNREVEIHLPGKQPTTLANKELFGTLDDSSDQGPSYSYKSKDTYLPWALNINTSIPYMVEAEPFTSGYRKFFEWVISNGTAYEDWYLDKDGYRNNEKLLDVRK